MALFKEKDTLKKMITLMKPNLFNTLVKVKALESGKTESEVIEDCVFDEFLNKSNKVIRDSVEFELSGGNFSVEKISESIFNHYSALPDKANDSLLPLINFLFNLEIKSPTKVDKNETIIFHLNDQLDSLIQYLEKVEKDGDCVPYGSGLISVDSSDIVDLKRLYSDLEKNPKVVGEFSEFVFVFSAISKFWAFEDSSSGLISFKNWTRIYRLLGDICRLADWRVTPEEAIKFLKITKNIE